ncbi:major facilitator superfamily domain-containing protein [Kockiozyma suomiensis]|uniref:major facilitator superfamily domain-containing protein n=1 Tax=Kockiozyma suomiensis TaxID=1337062 RepID=UPI00334414F8
MGTDDLAPIEIGSRARSRLSRLKQYLSTRAISLIPSKTNNKILNPIPALKSLTTRQWMFFLVAFLGWTWDAFEFFSVALTASKIADDLARSVAEITWGITVVLMLRSVGAIFFGLLSDKYGRKWPFIGNCVLFVILELATGFVKTYEQFLAVRALFGIAMGGIYGNCAATALEDCPVIAHGIISGMLQQGYAFGYLLAVVFSRALVDTTRFGWQPLFWFGAVPPVLIILFRLALPETDAYLSSKSKSRQGVKEFTREVVDNFRKYWHLIGYMIVLMTGFNFMSHGSQDLYPVMLEVQHEFTPNRVTVAMVIANVGAICGGTIVGHLSGYLGRRLSVIIACMIGAGLIYPWALPRSDGAIVAVFFLQFMVQGAWGVIPIYLSELSPRGLRAFVVGVVYQLGNLASSASSTIEASMGTRFPLEGGDERYDYGKVMGIFMGAVFFFVIVVVFVGPEKSLEKDDEEEVEAEKRNEQ